jgi:hypothetical protein
VAIDVSGGTDELKEKILRVSSRSVGAFSNKGLDGESMRDVKNGPEPVDAHVICHRPISKRAFGNVSGLSMHPMPISVGPSYI